MGSPQSLDLIPSRISLPFELMIMIAKLVDEDDPRHCSQHDVVRVKRGDLLSLSLVNKWFRQASIAAGLFANLEPRPTLQDATAFLLSLHAGYHDMRVLRVDSVCVNLANPKAWPLCVHLLDLYPDVPELRLSGESRNLRELQDDDPDLEALRNGLRAFKGHSLVIRNMHITQNVTTTLMRLRFHNITSIDLQLNGRILLRDNEAGIMSFPNLKNATISCSNLDWKTTVPQFNRHFLGKSKSVTELELLYCWQGKEKWVGALSDNHYRWKWHDLTHFLKRSIRMKLRPQPQLKLMIKRIRKCEFLASKDDGLLQLKRMRPFVDRGEGGPGQSAMAIRMHFD